MDHICDHIMSIHIHMNVNNLYDEWNFRVNSVQDAFTPYNEQ